MSDLEQFRKLAQPPPWALRKIAGGRLKGMTDIKPAWRVQAMTEAYGLCGVGWKYEVVRTWTEPGTDGQRFAFADVLLYIRHNDGWSEPIPGCGGNMLVEKERGGLHSNDEAFKMAITDALSYAMRMIGMGADVYAGQWDGSKYGTATEPPKPPLEPDAILALNEAITNAAELEAFLAILRGPSYTHLKLYGPADEYERTSKLARAKHAVLEGEKDAASDSQLSGREPSAPAETTEGRATDTT